MIIKIWYSWYKQEIKYILMQIKIYNYIEYEILTMKKYK